MQFFKSINPLPWLKKATKVTAYVICALDCLEYTINQFEEVGKGGVKYMLKKQSQSDVMEKEVGNE